MNFPSSQGKASPTSNRRTSPFNCEIAAEFRGKFLRENAVEPAIVARRNIAELTTQTFQEK
jgi:hypothetical protein